MDADAKTDPEQPRSPAVEAESRRRRIRWKTAAIGLVCLALLWAVISIRMGAGEDPALGAGSSQGSTPSSGLPEAPEGLPRPGGGDPRGSAEGLPFGSAPGGEGAQPEAGGAPATPGGSEEQLAPLHSRQS